MICQRVRYQMIQKPSVAQRPSDSVVQEALKKSSEMGPYGGGDWEEGDPVLATCKPGSDWLYGSGNIPSCGPKCPLW